MNIRAYIMLGKTKNYQLGLFAFLLTFQCLTTTVSAQTSNFVTIDKHQYTVEELVKDVLLESGISTVSDIIGSAGDINDSYGIGYFKKNNSNFPIQEGIIIRSGNVELSGGPYDPGSLDENFQNLNSKASNLIDEDLQVLSNIYADGDIVTDASYLQFDFIPSFSELSFDFLFASNEYGSFQCSYTDLFGFFIKDLSVPNSPYLNIALVPHKDIPISVTTIRNSLHNSVCVSQNETLFGQYNEHTTNSAINFKGQTVVMQAKAPVIAGHTYRIKLAVGDYWDFQYDSAVFITAGSFKSTQPCLPIPTADTSQYTCSVTAGEIIITSPLGADLTYSIDGVNFFSSPIFSNLLPGTYSITVRDTANCTRRGIDQTINIATATPPPIATVTLTQPICDASTGSIEVVGPLGADLSYSIDGITFQSSTVFSNVASGNYIVTVQNGAGCTSVTPATINAALAIPPIAAIILKRPTCTSTGSIEVIYPLGADLSYSIDGITFQNSTIFSYPPSGNYIVTVQNSAGCTSLTPVTINAAPAVPPIATIILTQPTCDASTGSIEVVSPLGADLTYSIDGITFQSSTIFNNVASGNHIVTVQNGEGCTSVIPATINTAPAVPPFATIVLTQPMCDASTGSIEVVNPLGADLTYSIDGITFQSSTIFSNVASGNYIVTVQNGAGCTSVTPATISAAPAVPPIATIVLTQPTCDASTGSIEVVNPLGADLTYSIDGITFQGSTIFSNVTSGNYIVTVQNGAGCTSVTPATISAAPAVPPIATIVLTQPTCDASTGSIEVVNPLGADLTYSIDGITFQSSTIFNNVASGNYIVTVQNGEGCTSVTPITISVAPAVPPIATIVLTQPTCDASTGSIEVVNPFGADLTYSIDGITFQSSTIFSNVASGNHIVTVQNGAGCTSLTPATINAAPVAASPIATVTVRQPTCDISTGSIEVVSPIGVSLSYSIDEVNFQSSRTFYNLKPGTYKVSVKNSGSCTSLTTDIIIQNPQDKLPELQISILKGCDDYGENDGISVFDLTQIENTIQNRNSYSLTYHYNEADATLGTNKILNPSNFKNTQPYAQTIWIRIFNPNLPNCYRIERLEVKIANVPDPIIKGGTICVDYITGKIVRPLLIETGLENFDYDFMWFLDDALLPGETNSALFASKPGKYTVGIVSRNDDTCIASSVEAAIVFQSGAAIPLGKGYVVKNAPDGKRTITAKITGHGKYEFKIDDGLWQDSPVFKDVARGKHILAVRDVNPDACDELFISIENQIDYPNFFTPNGDGYNDTWNINSLRDSGAAIFIYDRYGKLIKEMTANIGGWDGTFKGNPLPATDYWFKVIYPEFDGTKTITKEFHSHFSLKR